MKGGGGLPWSHVWLLFGAAFLLRLAAGILRGGFTAPETFEADHIARSLLAGDGFVMAYHGGVPYHSVYAPMFPWISAAMYLVGGGGFVPLMLLQMVASSATVALVAWMGARLFSRPAGLAAGLLLAVHPALLLYSSTKAHELSFDALVFVVVFWRWIRVQEDPSNRNAEWLGVVTGLSMLERPTALVFLPAGAAWLWWHTNPVDRRLVIRQLAKAAAIAVVILTPWTIRNVAVHDRPVFIRSTDWEVFWRGNNPNATGTSFTPGGQPMLETLAPSELAELYALRDEDDQADWFRRRAFAFISENPGSFVGLTARKLFYFWWISPQAGTLYARWWRYAYQAFYAFLLTAAAAGIWLAGRRYGRPGVRAMSLVGAMVLPLSVLQSLYYVDGRHRWGIEPLVVLLAGAGLAALVPHGKMDTA